MYGGTSCLYRGTGIGIHSWPTVCYGHSAQGWGDKEKQKITPALWEAPVGPWRQRENAVCRLPSPLSAGCRSPQPWKLGKAARSLRASLGQLVHGRSRPRFHQWEASRPGHAEGGVSMRTAVRAARASPEALYVWSVVAAAAGVSASLPGPRSLSRSPISVRACGNYIDVLL